jgi:hypothetical protein
MSILLVIRPSFIPPKLWHIVQAFFSSPKYKCICPLVAIDNDYNLVHNITQDISTSYSLPKKLTTVYNPTKKGKK